MFQLRSGCEVELSLQRLVRFMDEEYEYYDAIPSAKPDRIEPIDVEVTVAVNSFVNTAARLRAVHRGLARSCDHLLARIPLDCDLAARDAPVNAVDELLDAAVQVPGVLIPVATKVLHRKRPSLVPMLDQIVLDSYLSSLGRDELRARTQDKQHAASVAGVVLRAFRGDLLAASEPLEQLGRALKAKGYQVTPVRLLEVLIWTQVEERGYYRSETTRESQHPSKSRAEQC